MVPARSASKGFCSFDVQRIAGWRCGQVDDHPRHTFAGELVDLWPVNEELRDRVMANIKNLMADGEIELETALRIGNDYADTTSTDRHIDCCAAAGCPKAGQTDEETGMPLGCEARVAVWNGKTGKGMHDAAMKVRADHVKES